MQLATAVILSLENQNFLRSQLAYYANKPVHLIWHERQEITGVRISMGYPPGISRHRRDDWGLPPKPLSYPLEILHSIQGQSPELRSPLGTGPIYMDSHLSLSLVTGQLDYTRQKASSPSLQHPIQTAYSYCAPSLIRT